MADQQFTIQMHITTECQETVSCSDVQKWIDDNLENADMARISSCGIDEGFLPFVTSKEHYP